MQKFLCGMQKVCEQTQNFTSECKSSSVERKSFCERFSVVRKTFCERMQKFYEQVQKLPSQANTKLLQAN